MSMIIDGTAGATFPDSSTQAKAGLVAGGTIATGTVTTLTTTTLNSTSGVLATQNGMTGIAKAYCTIFHTGSGGFTYGQTFNVTSVTYTATGQYTVNFTTAMPNANYAGAVQCSQTGVCVDLTTQNTSNVNMNHWNSATQVSYTPVNGAVSSVIICSS